MASRSRGGGITPQAGRFAVLAPDTDSDSDENESWQRVPKKGKSSKGKKEGGQSRNGEVMKEGTSKAAAKNAKRRAKKRNQESVSSDCVEGPCVQGQSKDGKFSDWQTKDTIMAEKEFERNLEVALMNSMVENCKDQMDKLPKEEECGGDKQKSKSKKGVTLSLQDFHNADFNPLPLNVSPTNYVPNGQSEPDFFGHAKESLRKELRKEHTLVKTKDKSEGQRKEKSQNTNESVRVAQLRDELEKKEETMAELRDMNSKLQEELKEVKRRNQVLYKMLSKGEISSKSELLQQLEDISLIRDELTVEVERLHEELEQERSRNKSLKSELQSKIHLKH